MLDIPPQWRLGQLAQQSLPSGRHRFRHESLGFPSAPPRTSRVCLEATSLPCRCGFCNSNAAVPPTSSVFIAAAQTWADVERAVRIKAKIDASRGRNTYAQCTHGTLRHIHERHASLRCLLGQDGRRDKSTHLRLCCAGVWLGALAGEIDSPRASRHETTCLPPRAKCSKPLLEAGPVLTDPARSRLAFGTTAARWGQGSTAIASPCACHGPPPARRPPRPCSRHSLLPGPCSHAACVHGACCMEHAHRASAPAVCYRFGVRSE